MAAFATNWRDLSGENEWKGLLDPLDNVLRRYILHYGDRAEAVGDGFIDESKSKNFGLPRYAKRNFFSKVGLELGNPYKYVVTNYLYAAVPIVSSGKSTFLGYVAVSTDEGSRVLGRRDILISWRGTKSSAEVVIDFVAGLVPAPDVLGKENTEAEVHSGWHGYYTNVDPFSPHNNKNSCRDQVLAAVRELVDKYKNEEISITVTGHSMGAALATLNATDIVNNGYNIPTGEPAEKACLVTAIVFASPRLGNQAFKDVLSGLENIHILHVTNDQDRIPKLPPVELSYVDVGEELRINTLVSSYLKNPENTLHELEVYLHGVAGTQGINSNQFQPEGYRDLALVNKTVDALRDDLKIVAKWWTEKNRSMVQGDDGSWVLDDHEKDDD